MTTRAVVPFSPGYPPEQESQTQEAKLILRQMAMFFKIHKTPDAPHLSPQDVILAELGKSLLLSRDPTLLAFVTRTQHPSSAPRPRRTIRFATPIKRHEEAVGLTPPGDGMGYSTALLHSPPRRERKLISKAWTP